MAKAAKGTPARPANDVIDTVGVSVDEVQTKNDGLALTSWLKGLAGFFTTATAMERTAETKLQRARALTPPTNADEDVILQEFVKGVNGDDKDIDTHWEICGVAFRFHLTLTAARDRGKDKNKLSRTIATKLHNDYTEAAKRLAAQEQERQRQAREAEARAEQERTALAAEAEAVKREQASPDLSDREAVFVEAICTAPQCIGNPTAAATRANYKDPQGAGARLMKTEKIQKAIEARHDAIRLRRQADAIRDQPVEVRTEEVKPEIKKAAQTHDMTRWGAEVLDAAALLEAVLAGVRKGDETTIPTDLLMINLSKVNEYGKSMHEKIDLWPGVRHTKKVTIV